MLLGWPGGEIAVEKGMGVVRLVFLRGSEMGWEGMGVIKRREERG